MARPKAADLPRPRAAVKVTVLLKLFSEMASTKVNTAFPYPINLTIQF